MIDQAIEPKKVTAPQPAILDLAREIEQTAERLPDETIKAIRVFDNYYRCNWWVQDKSTSAYWLASGTIRKSRLLQATKSSDGLVMKDVLLTPALRK